MRGWVEHDSGRLCNRGTCERSVHVLSVPLILTRNEFAHVHFSRFRRRKRQTTNITPTLTARHHKRAICCDSHRTEYVNLHLFVACTEHTPVLGLTMRVVHHRIMNQCTESGTVLGRCRARNEYRAINRMYSNRMCAVCRR